MMAFEGACVVMNCSRGQSIPFSEGTPSRLSKVLGGGQTEGANERSRYWIGGAELKT